VNDNEVADKRTAAHEGQASQRILNPDHDRLGIAGEIAFGKLIGQDIDRRDLKGRGDGGKDFDVTIRYKVDVKTASSHYGLWVEEGKLHDTDIFVLAIMEKHETEAKCIGWCWRLVVENAPVDEKPFGISNHKIKIENLRFMDELTCRIEMQKTPPD
jgi:hypothetical protein